MANEDLYKRMADITKGGRQQKGMAVATSPEYRNPIEEGADLYVSGERNKNLNNMGEFTRGAARGYQQAKGMFHGARALFNQATGDYEDRNSAYADMLEAETKASRYPGTVNEFTSIGDHNGFLEDSVDYVLGSLGELAPSMAEAAVGSLLGFAMGSAVPGAGNVGGAIAGLLGKRAIRKGAKTLLKEMIESGIEKKVAEKMVIEQLSAEARRQIGKKATQAALSKAGMFAATAQMEIGGNYGEAVENLGFDDANVAAAVGTGLASAGLELLGGQSRIINKFLGPESAAAFKKAVDIGDSRLITRMLKEAATQGGEEFLQEGGQELMSVVNLVLNGDPKTKLISPETGKRLFEAGMKGMVGGVATGAATGAVPDKSRASNMGAAVNKKKLSDTAPLPGDDQSIDSGKPPVAESEPDQSGPPQNAGVSPLTEEENSIIPKATPKPEESIQIDSEGTAEARPAEVTNGDDLAHVEDISSDSTSSATQESDTDYSAMSAEDLINADMNDGVRSALESRRDNLKKSLFDSNGEQRKGLPEKMIANYEAIEKKLSARTAAEIEVAAHESATSPENDLPEPTQAQKEAGNYKMGHTKIHGMDITIENPKGSERSGVDPNGAKWSVSMPAHYGYVKRTEGADGDHVDVYIGENPESEKVFIVDQNDANSGKFDEHKVILGANSLDEAKALYSAGFSDGRANERIGNITETNVDGFKTWLKDGDQSKPAAKANENALPSADDFDAMFDDAMNKVENTENDEKQQKPTYADPRLKRKQFRADIVGFVEANSEIASGGEVVGQDELGKGGWRAPSSNPQWVQQARELVGSVEKLRHAISKAAAGDTLGPAQTEAVKIVLDEYTRQRVDHRYDKAVENLKSSRAFRRTIKESTGVDISRKDLAEDGYNDLTEPGKEAYNALVLELADDDFLERLAIQHEGKNDDEFYEEATREIRSEIERRNHGKTETVAPGRTGESNSRSDKDGSPDSGTEAQVEKPTLYDGDQGKMFATPPTFGKKAQPKSHATNDDLHFNDLIEESKQGNLLERAEEGTDNVESDILDGSESRSAAHEDRPKPAEHFEEAKKQAKIAAVEAANAIKKILKNASNPNKLNTGFGIDDEVYKQIRPHLQSAWKAAKKAYGETREAVADFIKQIIEMVGADVRPYAKKYYSEILGGTAESDAIVDEKGSDIDVSSADTNTERHGKKGEVSESVDEGTIRDERGGVSVDDDEAGRSSSQEGPDGSSDSVVSDDSPSLDGESGDNRVYIEDSTDGAEISDAGDFDGRRGDGLRAERKSPSKSKGKGPAESSVQQTLTREEASNAGKPKNDIPGDLVNVREHLPMLLDGQQEDVAFAERRLIVNDGRGVAFTNGTGTGKTFTGLGIVKRSVDRGQDNIFIAVPSDDIARVWVSSAKAYFNLDITQLKDTKDNGGSGPVITSYANFYQNYSLAEREWDLFLYDESHTLNYNKNGDDTAYQQMMRALSHHPKGVRRKAEVLYDDEFQELNSRVKKVIDQRVADGDPSYLPIEKARKDVDHAQEAVDLARKNKDPKEEITALSKDLSEAKKELAEIEEEFSSPIRNNMFGKEYRTLYQKVNELAESLREYPQGKVVFLSATIFPYEKSIDYAEGFLFDYGSAASVPGRASYEESPRDNFFVQHFGYRIRYGKLTEPDAEVDRSLMQINFNRWLREQGVLSTRLLDVPRDYSRQFALVDDAIGMKIDEGIKYLLEYKEGDQKPFSDLFFFLQEQFNHIERVKLLEAIKAKSAVNRVRKHVALGRKVVVFHNFNVGGAVHPFHFAGFGDQALIQKFADLRPDLYRLNLSGLKSPIETFKEAFGDDLSIINGMVSKKKRPQLIDRFNDSNSGKDVVLLQKDAGKQGVSLHDIVGDKQRVIINLGMPANPVDAIQIEGRIYRIGLMSDAIFEYLNTGTNFERWAFANAIAQRTATAENLAVGHEARDLLKAFVDAYEASDNFDPNPDQGTGGKEADRRLQQIDKFDEARSYYFAQMKRNQKTRAAEGNDYYATPEPLGLKMVEWADIRKNESALEPSAGHGAIARWMPAGASNTFVEPSFSLGSRLGMLTNGTTKNQSFEELHIANKYDAIVMNPPYNYQGSTGGKMAMDHLEKATRHLNDGGRIVAIVPDGPAFNKRFDKWYESEERGKDRYGKHLYLTGEISLPEVTFKRAGTNVRTKILVLERHPDVKNVPSKRVIAIPGVDINDFFSELRDISWGERTRYESVEEKHDADNVQRKTLRDGAPALEKVKQHHLKGGYDYFTVRLSGAKISDEWFDKFRSAASTTGAKYSTYRRGGVIPGYIFKDEAAADSFIDAVQPVIDQAAEDMGYADTAFSFGESSAEPASPVKVAKVERIVEEISGGLQGKPEIIVVASEAALPQHVRDDILAMNGTGKTDGALNGGKAYIVANKIKSRAQIERILLHEAVFHQGVRKLFGVNFQTAMQDIFKQLGGLQGVKEIADKYGINLKPYYDAAEKLSRANAEKMIVDELLAHLGELGVKPSLIQRLVAAIRAGLRKIGLSRLAKFDESDLFRVLAHAKNIIVKGDGARYILNVNQAAETAAALNPDSDPEIMRRMERKLYVPERVHEETIEKFGQNRIGAAEKVARGSISGLRQVREISRSNWPEGEYSQLARNTFLPVEREAIREWAKEQSLILDNSQFNKQWEAQGKRGGAEHDVYFNEEDARWYKRQRLTMNDSYADYFQRLILTNALNETADGKFDYRIEGFIEDGENLYPVVSQGDIAGIDLSRSIAEINDYYEKAGFVRIDKAGPDHMGEWRIPGEDFVLSDSYGRNIHFNRDGHIIFIDPLIKPDVATKRDRIEAALMADKFGIDTAFSLSDSEASAETDEFSEIEERQEQAKGLKTKTVVERAQAGIGNAIKSFTRHFVSLDVKREQEGEMADILRLAEEIPNAAKQYAVEALHTVLDGLNSDQRNTFNWIIVLRDLARDVVNDELYHDGDPLPFGYETPAQVLRHLEKWEGLADENVKEAIGRRDSIIEKHTSRLVSAGLLPESVLDDPHLYYHHQVLSYMAGEKDVKPGVSSSELSIKKKGWQKARKGSELDYNTEYIQSEFEILSQGQAQIKTQERLRELNAKFGIAGQIREIAKQRNTANFYKMMIREGVFSPDDPKSDPLLGYRQKMAMGITTLIKMAAEGNFYVPGKFTGLVNKMAEIGEAYLKTGELESIDHPQFFSFLSWMIDNQQPGSDIAAMMFKAIASKNRMIKAALGDDFLTMYDLIPEGYREFKPKPGQAWYNVASIPEHVLDAVLQGNHKLLDSDVRRVLARGADVVWVLPENLVDTLENFKRHEDDGWIGRMSTYLMGKWKQWVLINPLRFFKYNLNNMSGDADIVFATYPGIFKHFKKAAHDLRAFHRTTLGGRVNISSAVKEELQTAVDLGILTSSITIREIPDINSVMELDGIMADLDGRKIGKVTRAWNGLKKYTTFRENILRLAAYRYFLENSDRELYGVSSVQQVRQIKDKNRRAALLARELLGDYGNLTNAGDYIRRHLIPFWSWVEINAPRYFRLFANLRHEEGGSGAQRAGLALALKGGKTTLKVMALFSLVQLWNMTFFPDEEKEFGDSNRGQMHIILGRNADGSIRSVRLQGAVSDMLSWVGLEDFPQDIKGLRSGDLEMKDLVDDAMNVGWKRLVNSSRPILKNAAESISGYSFYPDPSSPRPVYDRIEHLFSAWSLQQPYQWVAGKPKRGDDLSAQVANDLFSAFGYMSDPGEMAYYDIRNQIYRFLDKAGVERPSGRPTDKGIALHYYKQALKYGDLASARKYLAQYMERGGTRKGMNLSIKRSAPLAALPKHQRAKFLNSLSKEMKSKLALADKWYRYTYLKKR